MTVCGRTVFRFAFFGLLIASFCGCFPGVDLIGAYEKDVSKRQELWGGYAKGERYILLHDIFLLRDAPKAYKSKYREYAGVAPEELTSNNCFRHYNAPNTMHEYSEEADQWPEIMGIIQAGTKIECTKVIGWGTWMWPMSHNVYATILGGPYAGTLISTSDLSYWDKTANNEDVFVSYPNFNLLKKDDQTASETSADNHLNGAY